jgi:hypothetical protein
MMPFPDDDDDEWRETDCLGHVSGDDDVLVPCPYGTRKPKRTMTMPDRGRNLYQEEAPTPNRFREREAPARVPDQRERPSQLAETHRV